MQKEASRWDSALQRTAWQQKNPKKRALQDRPCGHGVQEVPEPLNSTIVNTVRLTVQPEAAHLVSQTPVLTCPACPVRSLMAEGSPTLNFAEPARLVCDSSRVFAEGVLHRQIILTCFTQS